MKNIVAGMALLALCGVSTAEEKKIKEGEVPRPVLEKIRKKYPTAKMTGFEVEIEGGKSSYEVKIADGAKQMEIVCSPDGKIVAEEEKIAIDAVPDKVRRTLLRHARYGAWTIQHAERVILAEKMDAPTYELKVGKGGASAELVFTADGTLTRTEEAPPVRGPDPAVR